MSIAGGDVAFKLLALVSFIPLAILFVANLLHVKILSYIGFNSRKYNLLLYVTYFMSNPVLGCIATVCNLLHVKSCPRMYCYCL